MELTQIQLEAVETAHSESVVVPDKMVRLLLLDADDLTAALDGLARAGLMEEQEGGGRYVLTSKGAVTMAERKARESAQVKRAARTWQPR
jgi:predicted transcriptional regulator